MKFVELMARFSKARFLKDESGATAIEYAMIAAIIALGIISSLQALPTAFSAMVTGVVAGL